jgi:PEP-CTERM motif
MRNTPIKSLLATLLLAGSCVANAAHLEVVDHLAAGGYSGLLDGSSFSFDATDISNINDIGLVGGNPVYSDGSEHGYGAEGYFIGATQSFSMYVTQFVGLGPYDSAYSGDAFVSLPAITLNIASDGEAPGSQVLVSFSGLASALNSYASGNGALGMDMSVTSGSDTLGSWLWDASEAGIADAPVSFSFNAVVGQQITLSAFMFSSLTGSSPTALEASAAGALNGSFSITLVPEASSYAMLLAGLGLMGFVARRRV